MTRTQHGRKNKFCLHRIVELHLGKIRTDMPLNYRKETKVGSQSEISGCSVFFQ